MVLFWTPKSQKFTVSAFFQLLREKCAIFLPSPLLHHHRVPDLFSSIIFIKLFGGALTLLTPCLIFCIRFRRKFNPLDDIDKFVLQVFRTRTPSDAISLTSTLLEYTPGSRLSPLQACAHSFFDELREPSIRLPSGRDLPKLFNFSAQGKFYILISLIIDFLLELVESHTGGTCL